MADCSSSDSDDEEYIPEGLPPSSPSDVSEGEPEKNTVGVTTRGVVKSGPRTRQAKSKQQLSARKKRGGTHLEGSVPSNGEEGGATVTGESTKEQEAKSRIDDLWASFKQDVGTKNTSTDIVSPDQTGVTTVSTKEASESSQGAKGTHCQVKTISIKKTYDFAGEEVEVEKEVAADSKEAIEFLESQSAKSSIDSIDNLSESELKDNLPTTAQGPSNKAVNTGIKRKGSGLSSVLQSLGKKQKLSTLEKSHLDWQRFKKDTGLQDELAHSTKDGYLAKQEFLQRTDLRQFELEREERLKRFKRLH